MKRILLKIYWIYRNLRDSTKVQSINVNRKAKFSSNVVIRNGVHVGKEVSVDSYSYISGPNTFVNSAKIGKYSSIALGVTIGLNNHNYNYVTTHPFLYSRKFGSLIDNQITLNQKDVPIIGHDVWIGTGAIILRGVNIGNGSVIAAGALVTKDVPPYAIVGGVPAKVIKFRFPQGVISELLKIKWWNWEEDKIKKYAKDFNDVNKFVAAHSVTKEI